LAKSNLIALGYRNTEAISGQRVHSRQTLGWRRWARLHSKAGFKSWYSI